MFTPGIKWSKLPLTVMTWEQWNDCHPHYKGVALGSNWIDAKIKANSRIYYYIGKNEYHFYYFDKMFQPQHVVVNLKQDAILTDSANICYRKLNALVSNYWGYGVNHYYHTYELTKLCVPAPINYGRCSDNCYIDVYKADISSAYGYELSRPLPQIQNAIIYKGYVKPQDNEVCFYLYYGAEQELAYIKECAHHKPKPIPYNYKHDYGAVAEKSIYATYNTCETPDKVETTLRCKLPKVSYFSNAINEIYDAKNKATNKEERQIYKDILNKTIGFFQSNKRPMYAYLTAVVIARLNARINAWTKQLKAEHNTILLIGTDSIMWSGTLSNIAIDSKFLGSFTYEYKKAQAYIKGPKCYQIGNTLSYETKCSGLQEFKRNKLKFGDIVKPISTAITHFNENTLNFYEEELINA